MPTLQIEIEIAEDPGTGYARNRLDRLAGSAAGGAVLSRIVAANPQFATVRRTSDQTTLLQVLMAAVESAEAPPE